MRLGVQRHGPRPLALGCAYDDLKRRLVAAARRNGGAPTRVGLAAAFLDIGELQVSEFGSPQSPALEDRAVAGPDRRAPVWSGEQLGQLEV